MIRTLRAALAAVALALACLMPGHSFAQGITRVCDQVVGPNGSNNCPETFASSPQVGLSTTVKLVKASHGIVSIVHCWNPNAQQIYVQIFNALPANVTLGSTVPVAFVPIAATSTGGWSISPLALGGFPTAISVAATTTATGAGAPSTAPDCEIYFN
jgi:hypothetical protein